MEPGSFKRFAAVFFPTIIIVVIPAVALHQNTNLYWQGRMISHGAASLDEDGRFFMFPRPQGGKARP